MDAYILSQVFGTSALLFRTGSYYLQSKFPDADTMRKVMVPAHAVSALSYACNGALVPAVAYAGATLRTALLSTHFGEKHKNLITALNIALVSAVTTALYERPSDLLALGGTIAATIGDYQGQGRYQRLPYLFARAGLWIPMAIVNNNWAMLAADTASLGLSIKAVHEHDIKNAGGPKANFLQNLKAYLHGIFFNSATGANIKGQVSTNPGHADIHEQYAGKLRDRPNPHFTPAHLEAHI